MSDPRRQQRFRSIVRLNETSCEGNVPVLQPGHYHSASQFTIERYSRGLVDSNLGCRKPERYGFWGFQVNRICPLRWFSRRCYMLIISSDTVSGDATKPKKCEDISEISLKMRFIGSLASFHDCGSGPGIELILRRCWLFTWFHAGFCQRTNSNIKFRLESTPVINEILADAVDQPTGFCCLDHER